MQLVQAFVNYAKGFIKVNEPHKKSLQITKNKSNSKDFANLEENYDVGSSVCVTLA